jgi:cobalamin biosynthesis protein CobD/CbiB
LILLLLVVLAAANGYAIWQIHVMRGTLDEMREEMGLTAAAERRSMLEHAREAAQALGEGQLDRASEELKRLEEMLRETQLMAEHQRTRALEQLDEARRALAEGGERAREEIDRLLGLLPRGDGEDAEEGE